MYARSSISPPNPDFRSTRTTVNFENGVVIIIRLWQQKSSHSWSSFSQARSTFLQLFPEPSQSYSSQKIKQDFRFIKSSVIWWKFFIGVCLSSVSSWDVFWAAILSPKRSGSVILFSKIAFASSDLLSQRDPLKEANFHDLRQSLINSEMSINTSFHISFYYNTFSDICLIG